MLILDIGKMQRLMVNQMKDGDNVPFKVGSQWQAIN